MKKDTSIQRVRTRHTLLALGCACSLALLAVPALNATAPATLQARTDQAPSLPLTATFEKILSTEKGPPFVLKLTNNSKEAVKVAVKIQLSVVVHSYASTRTLPEHVIEGGQTWIIPELAALDKVSVTAEGFAPLELTVH